VAVCGLVAVFRLGKVEADRSARRGGDRPPRLPNPYVRRLLPQAQELQHPSQEAWSLRFRLHGFTVPVALTFSSRSP
jgi:hypothetical protein